MDNAQANAVTSFSRDADEFRKVLDFITKQRDILRNFYHLSLNYEKAYVVLAFFLKPVGRLCRKEQQKLDERVEVLQEICKMYTAIEDISQKPGWEKDARIITATVLETLMGLLKRNQQRMQHWHPVLRDRLLNMNNAYNNVTALYSHFH